MPSPRKHAPLTEEVREQIRKVYDDILSVRETGRRVGVHENTVRQVLKASRGLCSDCPTPIKLGQRYCESCAKRRAEWMQERRKERRRQGICLECDERIQPPSTQYCDKHRLGHQKMSRNYDATTGRWRHEEYVSRDAPGMGVPEDWQRLKQIRHDYGQAGVEAWERDGQRCVLCSVHYRDKAIHIHHIDEDHTHNVADNLVCLCLRCHRLVHWLSQHPNPQHVFTWYIAHHPDHLIAQLMKRGQRRNMPRKQVAPDTTLTFDFVGS